ncbi:helix-turn-helix domain-containing protein [Microcystis viridis]|uniref:helix-turn-helix domain-containing protein n=1 Tax=Microcystis viridis TaxID=44822 RepID=UPI001F5496A8
MEKAYFYRFYPTPEQESLLRRTLGCVRLVYNKALHERTQAWYERQERLGYAQTSSMTHFGLCKISLQQSSPRTNTSLV